MFVLFVYQVHGESHRRSVSKIYVRGKRFKVVILRFLDVIMMKKILLL